MTVYVDTSAVLAVLDADDNNHVPARQAWEALLRGRVPLVFSSYVLVETWALVQSRLGLEAVRGFYEEICPLLGVVWVGEELHRRAAAALITANRRNLSLVDCVSFEVMRDLGVKSAFAFDPHFGEMGFNCMP